MAIIGLTDRPAAPPQLGTLRKGAPKPQNGNKPGADLKHFRFDSDDAEAVKLFKEIYGDEPRAIRVFVPFATTDQNFDAWREEWTASSLKHRCDGETMVRWLTPRGTYSDEPKPCPYLDQEGKDKGCKQTGRLYVIIPELKRFALVTVLTTSIHDILQIHANLAALESARGDLRGIPLILKRSPREISTPGDNGKRARREKWLITIEAAPSWVELQLTAQERAALPSVEPLALPAWDGDDEDEDETPPETVAAGAVSPETLAAIEKLWPKYGQKLGGKTVSFADYIHQKKGIADPRRMPQEDAAKMLEWLQSKALAVEPKPETVHQGEVVEEAETVSV